MFQIKKLRVSDEYSLFFYVKFMIVYKKIITLSRKKLREAI